MLDKDCGCSSLDRLHGVVVGITIGTGERYKEITFGTLTPIVADAANPDVLSANNPFAGKEFA